jgi:hypothetical protein
MASNLRKPVRDSRKEYAMTDTKQVDELTEYIQAHAAKWDRVMQLLSALYEAWAKSHVPWHEEVNELMRAYDEWLDWKEHAMYLTFRLNGTKARMMYRQGREEARHTLHESMRAGAVLIDAALEYKIVDALHAHDTEPARPESEVWLRIQLWGRRSSARKEHAMNNAATIYRRYFDEAKVETVSEDQARRILAKTFVHAQLALRDIYAGNIIQTITAWYSTSKEQLEQQVPF